MTRRIPFEAIENFRDFGDYDAGGRRLKRGLLYRAAHQSEATDSDLEALAALGVTVIVDLRRPNERERSPSRRWKDFAATVIENDIGTAEEDPWHVFIKGSDLSPEAFTGYMIDYYRDAPFVDRHVDLYSRYFEALATTEGPVLIHCAAGKDRTGILAALTHSLAGVGEEDILADFLLTNDPGRTARRAPQLTAAIEEMTGRKPSHEAVVTALGVDQRYLETAFAAIHERHGAIDAYLRDILGVDDARREAIHARLLD